MQDAASCDILFFASNPVSLCLMRCLICFLFPLLLLTSCNKSQNFRLKANMSGMSKSPVLVIYDDPHSYTDTIYHQGGHFSYTLTPDTLTLMRLVADSGKVIPVFADKGWTVSLDGTWDNPRIKGDGYNADYHSFLETVKGMTREESVPYAEEFIRSHPESFASAYLLEMYFTQNPDPDRQLIAELIEPLAGEVKDTRVVSTVIKALQSSGDERKDYVNVTGLRDRSGEAFHWANKDAQTVTLFHIWAAWDEASVEERSSHEELLKEFATDEFRVINVSIDYDRKEWEETYWDDSDQWIELCDFKGWDCALVKGQDIRRVPYTLLVDKNRRVQARDLHGEALKEKALRLVQEAKEKAERAEKKRK